MGALNTIGLSPFRTSSNFSTRFFSRWFDGVSNFETKDEQQSDVQQLSCLQDSHAQYALHYDYGPKAVEMQRLSLSEFI
jgi:hypothetical protein